MYQKIKIALLRHITFLSKIAYFRTILVRFFFWNKWRCIWILVFFKNLQNDHKNAFPETRIIITLELVVKFNYVLQEEFRMFTFLCAIKYCFISITGACFYNSWKIHKYVFMNRINLVKNKMLMLVTLQYKFHPYIYSKPKIEQRDLQRTESPWKICF